MELEGAVPILTHPLIDAVKAHIPHLAEAGAIDLLVLSTEEYEDTGKLCTLHIYARYLPGRGAGDAGIDFGGLMGRLATADMPPEIPAVPTEAESGGSFLDDFDLLLAWKARPLRGVPTLSGIEIVSLA